MPPAVSKHGKYFIWSAQAEKEVSLTVGLKTVDTHAMIDVEALLDSGATGLFINCALIQNNGIAMCKPEHPITVHNIDGTENKRESITEEVTMIMSYQGHKEWVVFEVCDLWKTNLIIQYKWLHKHNPNVNWQTGEVKMNHCPRECNMCNKQSKRKRKMEREKEHMWKYSVTMEEVPDEEMPNGEGLIMIEEEDDWHDLFQAIRGGQSWNKNPEKIDTPMEETVLEKYHEYLLVFQKKKLERMPLRKSWVHGTELKEGFVLKKSKVYPLSPQEQTEVDDFINDQLRKGCIQPLKSPQTSPIFFIPKRFKEAYVYWLLLSKWGNCQECVPITINFRDHW